MCNFKCYNFLISYPIFIIFAPICREIFTLSFEIMVILDWTSPLNVTYQYYWSRLMLYSSLPLMPLCTKFPLLITMCGSVFVMSMMMSVLTLRLSQQGALTLSKTYAWTRFIFKHASMKLSYLEAPISGYRWAAAMIGDWYALVAQSQLQSQFAQYTVRPRKKHRNLKQRDAVTKFRGVWL